MATTSARLLALLGLLQSRPDWGGPELAARLGVTDRTVRNDMTRLRDLGYPVDSVRGRGGRYRLGAGAKLPPLLLDDDEAVAVAVGLQAASGIAGVEETSTRALTKLEHVLPDRLRRKVAALRSASSAGPANTGSDAEDPAVDAAVLSDLAAAIRDHQGVRCYYRDEPLELQPYHLVSWQRRWYLARTRPGDRHLGAVPGRLDAAAHARRPAVPSRAVPRRPDRVRRPRGRQRRVGRARPDPGPRPGRAGARADQPRGRHRRAASANGSPCS